MKRAVKGKPRQPHFISNDEYFKQKLEEIESQPEPPKMSIVDIALLGALLFFFLCSALIWFYFPGKLNYKSLSTESGVSSSEKPKNTELIQQEIISEELPLLEEITGNDGIYLDDSAQGSKESLQTEPLEPNPFKGTPINKQPFRPSETKSKNLEDHLSHIRPKDDDRENIVPTEFESLKMTPVPAETTDKTESETVGSTTQ